jgi:hypothetical protein
MTTATYDRAPLHDGRTAASAPDRTAASALDRTAIWLGTALASWGRAHSERIRNTALARNSAERVYAQRTASAARVVDTLQRVR